jgi:aminopeptidase N
MGYKEQDTHLFSQGECHEAPRWYPNYDYPNERSTSEVVCRVPKDMVVLSNGRVVSETIDPTSGLKVVHWLQDKPHVNYLIALAAGRFEKIEARHNNIPLAFYTSASKIDLAQNSFEDTADAMAFFEQATGVPYPWDQYNQVVVEDFIAGGMENTTLTILDTRTLHTDKAENTRSSQGLVAHELAHQWFGDYVTCKDWSHLWLNEGFACYYTLLYDEHKNGKDSFLAGLYSSAGDVLADRSIHKPIVHRTYDHADDQFDYRTYSKGAWVLHMLRTQLGDDMYRNCVKTYIERYALSSVTSEDFRSVIEELTGRPFDRFFDQWIYHGRHPDLTVGYSWSGKDKLAKISVKQTHKVNGEVMLFAFDTKVRFDVGGDLIDREIKVDDTHHDFYFPLPEEPNIVRFDPEFGLLANIKFDKPTAMLYAQLENADDVIGRLRAVDALEKKNDKKTTKRLKKSLNQDAIHAVRIKAAQALEEIHTNEAFDALAASTDQSDARVRLAVVTQIGKFYRSEGLELLKDVLSSEKNPEILYQAIQSLGQYHGKETRKLLVRYLKSKSYRNQLADAAISAIRASADSYFINDLIKALKGRQELFTSSGFSSGLSTLARLASKEDNKTEVRKFLLGYVNHPRRTIQAGAIRALGTLGDPKAAAVIETFTGDDGRDYIQRTAKRALEELSKEKELVPKEILELRETVDELKKSNEKVKEELEDIKKRLDAKKDDEEQSSKD